MKNVWNSLLFSFPEGAPAFVFLLFVQLIFFRFQFVGMLFFRFSGVIEVFIVSVENTYLLRGLDRLRKKRRLLELALENMDFL